MGEDADFQVTVEQIQDYEFRVRFDPEGLPGLSVDEPPPVGAGAGPNASRLLAAAVGNCLSASLLFCLRKSRLQPDGVRSTVRGTVTRNEAGRLRIGALAVAIEVDGLETGKRALRCADLFEDFCVVTASVRQGIPVTVSVSADGQLFHESGE